MTQENYWADSAQEHYDMERAEKLGINYSDLAMYDVINKRFDRLDSDMKELSQEIERLGKITVSSGHSDSVKLFHINDNSNWIFWISILLLLMVGYIVWTLS